MISTDKQTSILDQLQDLLERQLELARQGNTAGEQIEVLCRQTNSIVEEITRAGILDQPEFKTQKNKLKKSYEDLHLALTAQKADTAEKLGQIRRGRKIIGIYHGNNRL